jgi:hypothetical protein
MERWRPIPSPRSTAQGSVVGAPKVASARPLKKQPSRPMTIPSAKAPTKTTPVEPVMRRARL